MVKVKSVSVKCLSGWFKDDPESVWGSIAEADKEIDSHKNAYPIFGWDKYRAKIEWEDGTVWCLSAEAMSPANERYSASPVAKAIKDVCDDHIRRECRPDARLGRWASLAEVPEATRLELMEIYSNFSKNYEVE